MWLPRRMGGAFTLTTSTSRRTAPVRSRPDSPSPYHSTLVSSARCRTRFSASGIAKISYILGAPDRNGNQKLTQSLTLSASGEGTAPNPRHSGYTDQAVGGGSFTASSTHTINQNP